jgi:hypothetical protein
MSPAPCARIAEPADRGDTRKEKVRTANQLDEALHVGQPSPNGVGLDRERSRSFRRLAADERIDFVQVVERSVVDPRLLDEFELPLEIATESDEMKTAFGVFLA